jgi:hypothetical protein
VPLIAELLARRVRSAGSAPLVTYYDTDAGVRTELSGTTFANWVAKTSNLLTDELLLDAGASVELLVAARHPAALVVCGPDYAGVDPGTAELVACSLHPLGLGLEPPVPPGVVDYAAEVRIQPDVWNVVPVASDAPAWHDHERTLDQTGLLTGGPAPAQRLLVRAGDPWATVRDAIVVPLRDGGSSVVLAGTADDERARQIGLTERVDAFVDD